ncbi:MAG: hypothetical protein ACREL5_11860 [Gemmatimonadales bacterium]
MQKAVLRIEWKACRHLVIALAVAAFALPIVSVRLDWQGAGGSIPFFLTELQLWGLFYPLLAAVAAIILAAATWASDRRGQHVYAMLLPVPRWRYVIYRYSAGVLMCLPVVAGLWLGAHVAIAGLDLPPGILTYPDALALKFGLSLLLLFGFAFAIASASSRAIGIGIRALGLFLAVHIAVLLLAPGTNLLWMAARALVAAAGPLSLLGGRWMLIDA